ncbi:MAG: cobalt ECF transporter T component CbiQ [Desulfobacterales bacterium]
MPEVIQIHLSYWQLSLLALAPPAILAILIMGLRRVVRMRATPGEDPDWSIPPLSDAPGGSWFHRWDVRCKILTIMVFCFMTASVRHLPPALAAIGISLAAVAISKSSLMKVLVRLLAICGFLCMILVIMPFTVPTLANDTILVFNGISRLGFNLRGLELAATIAAKAVAIALLMEPLLSTAPLPVTLHGLSRLGVPEIVGQMVLLSYRYLNVFRQEAGRMSSGMAVRGFRKRTDMKTLKAVSNFLGMLFVRSFERTERVFDAMRARGYKGRFPDPVALRLQGGDLVMSGVWLAAGTTLLVWDRMIG